MVHETIASRCLKDLLTGCMLSVGAVLLFSGCTGTPTRHEQAARQDIQEVKARYRPKEAKPPLPTLTETSGLADLLQYALLNNPQIGRAHV